MSEGTRHPRFEVVHRLMLRIAKPHSIEDIVTTVDVSMHGARILSRRSLPVDARGTIELTETRRQVPCRVVWQKKQRNEDGCFETGLELGLDPATRKCLWPELGGPGASHPSAPAAPHPAAEPAGSVVDLLAERHAKAGLDGLSDLLSAVIGVLEKRGAIKREELIETLRSLGR